MTKANPTEKDVKRAGKALFVAHHWVYWMPPANGFGGSGISDAHALKSGVFLAIEYKNDGNKPTELQKNFLRMVGAEGAIPMCVYPSTIIALGSWLASFDIACHAAEVGAPVDEVNNKLMAAALEELQRPFLD